MIPQGAMRAEGAGPDGLALLSATNTSCSSLWTAPELGGVVVYPF